MALDVEAVATMVFALRMPEVVEAGPNMWASEANEPM